MTFLGRARNRAHTSATSVEDARVVHRGLDIVVPHQLLHSTDVVIVFLEVGGEGMAKRLAR